MDIVRVRHEEEDEEEGGDDDADKQYLNCRGDASPHRDLSSGWSDEKDLILHPILAKKHFNFGEDLFFGLHLVLAKKHFNFRRRPFFLVFIQFRRRNYVIFTKVLSNAKCVWSRLQKRPPHAKFYN